jgi:hypothetical protein
VTTIPGFATRVSTAGVCCLIAALSYSGAVSMVGLLAFVLPAVLVVTALTAAVGRLSVRIATFSGLVAALVIAEVVNLVSGTSFGPAARSTFLAGAFTVLATAAVLSPAPTLFAGAVAGVVVGALALGAGAEVAPVAVATAVTTVVGIALVEALGRRWQRRPPHLVVVVLLALLVGGCVASVALRADRQLAGDPAVLAPGAVDPSIRPPTVLGDPDAPLKAETTQSAKTNAESPPAVKHSSTVRTIWLVILAVVVGLLLALLIRVAWVASAWRRLRRRLRRGSESEQVAGAWVWSTRRLRAAGWAIPPSLPPDAVKGSQELASLPRHLRGGLSQVASATVQAVFAPPGHATDVESTWQVAHDLGRGAVKALPRGRRLGFAVRSITSVPNRQVAPAPTSLEESRL